MVFTLFVVLFLKNVLERIEMLTFLVEDIYIYIYIYIYKHTHTIYIVCNVVILLKSSIFKIEKL